MDNQRDNQRVNPVVTQRADHEGDPVVNQGVHPVDAQRDYPEGDHWVDHRVAQGVTLTDAPGDIASPVGAVLKADLAGPKGEGARLHNEAQNASETQKGGSGYAIVNTPPDWLVSRTTEILHRWLQRPYTGKEVLWYPRLATRERDWLDNQPWRPGGAATRRIPLDRLMGAAAELTLQLLEEGLVSLDPRSEDDPATDSTPSAATILIQAGWKPKPAHKSWRDEYERRTIRIPRALLRQIQRATRKADAPAAMTVFANLAVRILAWVLSPGTLPCPHLQSETRQP